jgi:hypothetical protein
VHLDVNAGRRQSPRVVGDIAAKSGGSILTAHLVRNWDRYTGTIPSGT